ncbi:MAG: type II toxin-antitoxin system mRNA interferase toxin, RelE/StbE family [Xenococcaceae cyanobacterium MO_188.B19]|nr:type II toxin-antitoxin system mRNA interferase toxin, RelE/StbE family [Xenococcaceae cyanobacterium MO_188.B19]
MEYKIKITPLAIEMLSKIKDVREQKGLGKRIEKLKNEPDKQGKPLSGKLKGYRSIRALGQRYRIVYRVDQEKIIVIIIGLGIRKEGAKKDIYETLNKLLSD